MLRLETPRSISESAVAVGAGLVWGQVNVLLIYVLGVSCPLISGLFSIWQQSVNLLHLLIYQHRKWLMAQPGAIKIGLDIMTTSPRS